MCHAILICLLYVEQTLNMTKGRHKKNCFFHFWSKGGGGLGQSKKYLSENTQIFFDQKGGSHLIQKGFIRKTEIFWHDLPKKGGFI